MARPSFRGTARRITEEAELSPAVISLLSREGSPRMAVRFIAVDRIDPNPDQPRMSWDEDALAELSASVKEHGVLQPILVRPLEAGRYQLIAGERRWRASRAAELDQIPAIIEDIDDETALEIAIIENLQREDLSPLDEAVMYDRMVTDHGYSVRKLAQKLGKDKGYIENRLRLADAPPEVKQLVSLRKDTLSHAYELLKVRDERKRRRLAGQVARGELSLVKLRERIEGRQRREPDADDERDGRGEEERESGPAPTPPESTEGNGHGEEIDARSLWEGTAEPRPIAEDSLVAAKGHLAQALDELAVVLGTPDVLGEIPDVDRANLAKYLTIAKLKLENAIAVVRTTDPRARR